MPAIGTFFPGVASWGELIPDGAAPTVSADGETATLTDAVRTRSYDVGTTLARVSWDGTASGTIRGRTSASKLYRFDDLGPIQPSDSEWAYKFDGSLATAPTAQGWSKSGSITETLSGGALRMQSAGAAYYYINPGALLSQSDDLLVIRLSGLTLNSGHAGNFQLLHTNGSKSHSLLWTGSAYGSDTNKLSIGNLAYAPGFVATADTKFDYLLVVRRTGGTNTDARVFIKPTGSDDRYELAGMIDMGPMPTPSDTQTFIIFGALVGSGFDVSVDHIGAYSGTEWETVTDGDTSFARNQRHWQFKGWESGTLTELDIASDLAAPGNPSGPEAAAVGASAIGANCTSLATGAAAYWVECLDADNGDAVVADRWELEPAATFRGLTVPGHYKVRFTSASDDGVRGNTAATTASKAVPAAAATVALVLSDTSIVAGETATLTPTITGSVDVTLGGVAMTSGVAADAVSATAGDLIGPTAPAPTIGWHTYPRPTISWS